MARPINTLPVPADDNFDPQRLEEAGEAAKQLTKHQLATQENTLALANKLGYKGSLQPATLEDGVRESRLRVELELFAIGARLLLLKEQCSHGEFLECCDRLGFNPVMAQRTMRSTLKFANASTSTQLLTLGKSRIFELLVLDDEETDEFVAGGSVRGITYDDAAKMTVSELRKALREANDRLSAKDRVAADNQATMQRLQEQMALTQRGSATASADDSDDRRSEALDSLHDQVHEISNLVLSPLRSEFMRLADPALALGETLRRQALGAAIGRILAVTRTVAQDFDIPVSGPGAVEIDEDAQWDEIWAASLRDLDGGQARLEESTGHGDVAPD